MIVIDASALIEALLGTEIGLEILDRCAGSDLHAPHLIDLEVSNVLRRMVRRGVVPPAQGSAVVESFASSFVERWDHREFLVRAWQLRDQLSSYDAVYIAMAEILDAPLITSDAGMKAAIAHKAHVELFRPRPRR